MKHLESAFHNHGLKKTPFRKELLSLFYEVRSSLTTKEIKSKLMTSKDKVTVYRALDAFEKSGLIHRVPDKSNLIRYALCNSKCNSHQHTHDHAHFICDSCNETFCLDKIKLPKIKNTNGFNITNTNIVLEGVCPYC